MLNFDNKPHDEALDEVISSILTDLNSLNADDEEYDAASAQLVRLMELKMKINPSWRPSPDAIVGVIGTIITALVVLNFEKVGVITSKAFTFVGKSMK
jgi:hypothetical protein